MTQVQPQPYLEGLEGRPAAEPKLSPVAETPNFRARRKLRNAGQPLTKEIIKANCDFDSKTGCWNWKAASDGSGYGSLRWKGKSQRPHRVVWELWNGSIPAGLFICHHCDNRSCCNPQHLFLGTPRDNTRDGMSKSRMRFGKATSAELVAQIYAESGRPYDLAVKYGLCINTIRKFKRLAFCPSSKIWKRLSRDGLLVG